MGYGVKLLVWGDFACFTRPEMKAERVSYDVITPSAAQGILESIHWKPAIRWVVDKIYVLNKIKFDNIRRNEVAGKIPSRNITTAMRGGEIDLHQYATEERQQRASMILRDVAYVLEAHFKMTPKAGADDNEAKHYNIALRRMREGQCHHRPYFGCREFPVNYRLLEADEAIPPSYHQGERDLGWMLWGIDFENEMNPLFYRPVMVDGVIEVPDLLKKGGETS